MTEKDADYIHEQQENKVILGSFAATCDEIRTLTFEGMTDLGSVSYSCDLRCAKSRLIVLPETAPSARIWHCYSSDEWDVTRASKEIVGVVTAYVQQLEEDKFALFSGLSTCQYSNTYSYKSPSSTTSINFQSSWVTAAAEVATARARLKYLCSETEKRMLWRKYVWWDMMLKLQKQS